MTTKKAVTRKRRINRSTILASIALAFFATVLTPGAAHAAAGSSVLKAGEYLRAGQSLVTPTGDLSLVMQGDGNLVLYGNNRALWNSQTQGNPGAFAVMQGDGNLVVYNAGVTIPLWYSHTNGNPGAWMQIQDDGNMVVYSAKVSPLFYTGTHVWPAALASPAVIYPGASLISPNGAYQAAFGTDGNLVVSGPSGVTWNSGTAARGADKLQVQTDGNVVIYQGSSPLWYTGTAGRGAVQFQMQDDGNLVLYTTSGSSWTPVWATSWQLAQRSKADIAIAFATAQIGKPYIEEGDDGPDAFDCSGLTEKSWAAAGVALPHSSSAQYGSGRLVPYAQRQPGDLLFWATNTRNANTIHHVALYIGNGQMIEAPAPGTHVRVTAVWVNSKGLSLMDHVVRVVG